MNITREEQETGINIMAADKTALISTTDPVMMRRMDKLVANHPDVYEFVRSDEMSRSYTCNNKRLCWPRAPRKVSNEQREAARKRLAEARAAKE